MSISDMTFNEKGQSIYYKDNEDLLDLDTLFLKTIRANGLYEKDYIDKAKYNKFARWGYIEPDSVFRNTREYIFFTRPDLNIFENQDSGTNILAGELNNIPTFLYALNTHKRVLEQLQYSASGYQPFINLLSNTVKSSLDLPSIDAREIDTAANIYGTKMSYRKGSMESDNAFDFSLEFEDTKYLEIYMFFKLFDLYSQRKQLGEIGPADYLNTINKILHDQISIFKLIVDDTSRLVYWALITGCYPKNVPRDVMGDLRDTVGLRINTQWKGQFVDDMNPLILEDFNALVYKGNEKELPLYNSQIGAAEPDWASYPYIVNKPITKNGILQNDYFLKWAK